MLSYAQYTYSVHCTFLVVLGQVACGLIVTKWDFLRCYLPLFCAVFLTPHLYLSDFAM
jgi:hypothetical protein